MGPVASDTSGEKVRVDGHILEHDVSLNVIVVFLLVDKALVAGGDGHVLATEGWISDKDIEDLLHILLHVDAVLLGHGAGEGVLVQVSASADSHGEIGEAKGGKVELTILGEALNTGERPVVDVLLDGKVDLVVLGERLLEEGGELVVVLGVHGVAAHAGVGVLDAGEAAGEEADLLVLGEGLVVLSIESLSHAVVGLGGLDLEDLFDDERSGLSIDVQLAVLGFDTTFNRGGLAAHGNIFYLYVSTSQIKIFTC